MKLKTVKAEKTAARRMKSQRLMGLTMARKTKDQMLRRPSGLQRKYVGLNRITGSRSDDKQKIV